jgi:hypothetical protein
MFERIRRANNAAEGVLRSMEPALRRAHEITKGVDQP